MTTINLYNHTARKFANGENAVGDTYKLALYSALTPNAAHTTLAQVNAAGTPLGTANGYTAGGQTLANVAVTTETTNDAKFDADDVEWNASGGPITASFGVLYNDTDTDDPPVAWIDFEGEQSAGDGTKFIVSWNASGILTFTVT
jgi:hypothetical protein